jgi:hypothetical protein
MKIIMCDLCSRSEILRVDKVSECKCGNIAGKYRDNGTYANIWLKDDNSLLTSRVIGVNNSLMLGLEKRATCHIGDWDDYQLFVYIGEEKLDQHEGTKKKFTEEDVNEGIVHIL